MTKVRVDTREMMNFVKGKRMEESDLCMLLEDLGVVLDRATWTHFKEVYAQSHAEKDQGTKLRLFFGYMQSHTAEKVFSLTSIGIF